MAYFGQRERNIQTNADVFNLVYKLAPDTLCSIIPCAPTTNTVTYNTRQQFDLPHYRARTELYDKYFFQFTVTLWDELPVDIRNYDSIQLLKSKISQTVVRPIQLYEL